MQGMSGKNSNYFFGNDSVGFGSRSGPGLLDLRRLDELVSQGRVLQRSNPEILEAESVAAAAAVAVADARLRFFRARRTFALASRVSARSASFDPGPAVRSLWSAALDIPDRGPLATVSFAPPVVRRTAESAHRTTFRQQQMREGRC